VTLLHRVKALILAENVLYNLIIMKNTCDMLLLPARSYFFRGIFEEPSIEA
jgi:hypothetical protein